MGFRICYIASRATPGQLAHSLGLSTEETCQEVPEQEDWIGRLKKSGWTVLWSEAEDFGQQVTAQVAQLSHAFDTYICEVNETVMWSAAEYWSGGCRVWRLTHAGDGGDLLDLTETGALPEAYSRLKDDARSRQRAEREGVDHIFDVPLDLAALDFGFRHDDWLEPGEVGGFVVIRKPCESGRAQNSPGSRIRRMLRLIFGI